MERPAAQSIDSTVEKEEKTASSRGGERKPDPAVLQALVDRIESEMRSMGLWDPEPLPTQKYDFREAFAMDTMTFAQWLQFVFLPRARAAIASGTLPDRSEVGAQAVREFDGLTDAGELVRLLSLFDRQFHP